MRNYEALIIFKAVGTDQELAHTATQVEEAVKKLGGRMERSQSLGRRRLAFRIARQTEGQYHVLRFAAQTDRVAELKRLLMLNESIIRFLILSQDDDGARAKRPLRAPGTRRAVEVAEDVRESAVEG